MPPCSLLTFQVQWCAYKGIGGQIRIFEGVGKIQFGKLKVIVKKNRMEVFVEKIRNYDF